MPNALDRGTPFNPMRFRDEIKAVESSIARLEMLLKRHKTYFNLREKDLPSKIKQETTYLGNIWRELESNFKEVEDIEIPYFFLREHTKWEIARLLGEASRTLKESFL